MMEQRPFLMHVSRLACLAVILMMGLGLVACSDDEPIAPVVPPPGPPPPNAFGTIKLYSDAAGTVCDIAGNPTGLQTVYLVHSDHQGVTGSQFRIDTGGTGFVWIGDQVLNRTLAIGTTTAGASFAYGACYTWDYNFATVIFQSNGTALPCSRLQVVAESVEGVINSVSCGNVKSAAYGSSMTVNCATPGSCGPIPTAPSWGAIEALNE